MFQCSCVIAYYNRFMKISMFQYQSVIDQTFLNNPLKWQGARSGYLKFHTYVFFKGLSSVSIYRDIQYSNTKISAYRYQLSAKISKILVIAIGKSFKNICYRLSANLKYRLSTIFPYRSIPGNFQSSCSELIIQICGFSMLNKNQFGFRMLN